MLENAVKLCPENNWNTDTHFWHYAYHTIFYLDYYLSTEPDNFAPPAPFGLSEFDPSGALPERVYTQSELLSYIDYCRTKLYTLMQGMTEESAMHIWKNEYRSYTMFELLLYNMRHVQHHTAQLNLLLRQGIQESPGWVSRTKQDL